ncbi:hypothetical protein Tco_0606788 [Tanacetum coccineum]
METIQAFLKEYDHIPPEEKCMALLLADERFLKIKQDGIQPKQQAEIGSFKVSYLNWNIPMSDDAMNISITSPKIDFLPEEFAGELDLIDPILPGIDEDDCDENDFDEEEGEIDDDILQIEDEILHEKLLNVNLLINKIEALILLLLFLLCSNIPPLLLLPDIIFSNDLLNDDPILEYERFTFDIEPDAPVINNFDELNEDECFDPGGGEIDVSQNVEDDDSFAFVIRTFLPYLIYPVDSPLLLSTRSEDTIFDPGIST